MARCVRQPRRRLKIGGLWRLGHLPVGVLQHEAAQRDGALGAQQRRHAGAGDARAVGGLLFRGEQQRVADLRKLVCSVERAAEALEKTAAAPLAEVGAEQLVRRAVED